MIMTMIPLGLFEFIRNCYMHFFLLCFKIVFKLLLFLWYVLYYLLSLGLFTLYLISLDFIFINETFMSDWHSDSDVSKELTKNMCSSLSFEIEQYTKVDCLIQQRISEECFGILSRKWFEELIWEWI